MRAWVVHEFGRPADVLRLDEVAGPEPGPGEVAVDLTAASMGFQDNLLCAGEYQIRPAPPFTPGFEGAGTVQALGPDVTGLSVGDRVIALPDPGVGTFRERTVAPAARVYPIPDSLAAEEAAALFVPYQTAWLALYHRARLQAGETVLVHGGAGGVGSAAIQLAVAAGARVLATAGGPEHVRICTQLGAELGIDHRTEDVVAVVKEATGGRGVDVVFDPIGGTTFDASTRCIGQEGRILVIGFVTGPSTVRTNHLLIKNYSVIGVFYGPSGRQQSLSRTAHQQLMDLHARGAIAPLIGRRVRFEDVPEGLAALAAGGGHGKTVVTLAS